MQVVERFRVQDARFKVKKNVCHPGTLNLVPFGYTA